MRVVVALGGNALLQRGQPADADAQRRNVAVAVEALAELAREHEVVVTHGNGPQVGLLALQGEAYAQVEPVSARRARRRERGDDRLPARPGARQRARRTPGGDAAHAGDRRRRRSRVRRTRRSSSARSTTARRPSRLAAERGWQVRADGAALAPRRALAGAALDRRAADHPAAGRGRRARRLRRRRRHPRRRRPRRPPARRRGGDRQGPRRRAAGPWPRRGRAAAAHRRGRRRARPRDGRRPRRSRGRRPTSCSRSACPPARWAPRSRPPRGSRRSPAAVPRSAASPRRPRCSPVAAGRRSSRRGVAAKSAGSIRSRDSAAANVSTSAAIRSRSRRSSVLRIAY